jgi:hypothetical protein
MWHSSNYFLLDPLKFPRLYLRYRTDHRFMFPPDSMGSSFPLIATSLASAMIGKEGYHNQSKTKTNEDYYHHSATNIALAGREIGFAIWAVEFSRDSYLLINSITFMKFIPLEQLGNLFPDIFRVSGKNGFVFVLFFT